MALATVSLLTSPIGMNACMYVCEDVCMYVCLYVCL